MKKVKILIFIFLMMILVGCNQDKKPENPALTAFKEFEKTNNVKMELRIGSKDMGQMQLLDYTIVENSLIQMELSQTDVKFILDLSTNHMYYEGYEWNGIVEVEPDETINSNMSFTDYMDNISYQEEDNVTFINAKIDFQALINESGLFDIYEDVIFEESPLNDIVIEVKDNKVEEICIYQDKETAKDEFIKLVVYSYGEDFYNTITLANRYEFVNDEETFNDKMGLDLEHMLGLPSTSGYQFSLDRSNYYIKEGTNLNLSGNVYYNQNLKNKVWNDDIEIVGYYDINTPGEYKLYATTNCADGALIDEFVLTVIGDKNVNASLYTAKTYLGSKYQFAFDKYYGICDNKKLYLYDLDNNNCYTFDLKGHGSSYFAKDNYLYVTSYEDYDNYYYLDDDEFVGHIFKINLTNLNVEKDVTINRYPYSIVVDKYDNVFISKGNNGFEYIEKVDLDTLEITPFKEYVTSKSQLLYDEQSESIILAHTASTAYPCRYKYDPSTKTYKFYFEYGYVKDQFCNASRNLNKVMYGSYLYDFSNSIMTCVEIFNHRETYPSSGFSFKSVSNITNEEAIAARSYSGAIIVGTYNLSTKVQTNYYITNVSNSEISSTHSYNGKIYFFNQVTGELLYIIK